MPLLGLEQETLNKKTFSEKSWANWHQRFFLNPLENYQQNPTPKPGETDKSTVPTALLNWSKSPWSHKLVGTLKHYFDKEEKAECQLTLEWGTPEGCSSEGSRNFHGVHLHKPHCIITVKKQERSIHCSGRERLTIIMKYSCSIFYDKGLLSQKLCWSLIPARGRTFLLFSPRQPSCLM